MPATNQMLPHGEPARRSSALRRVLLLTAAVLAMAVRPLLLVGVMVPSAGDAHLGPQALPSLGSAALLSLVGGAVIFLSAIGHLRPAFVSVRTLLLATGFSGLVLALWILDGAAAFSTYGEVLAPVARRLVYAALGEAAASALVLAAAVIRAHA